MRVDKRLGGWLRLKNWWSGFMSAAWGVIWHYAAGSTLYGRGSMATPYKAVSC